MAYTLEPVARGVYSPDLEGDQREEYEYPHLLYSIREDIPGRPHPKMALSTDGRPLYEVHYQQVAMPVPARYVEGFSICIEDAPFAMPDFFRWKYNASHLIVSDRVRSVLETLASGDVEYLPISVIVPAHMNPASAYFYINVLPREMTIDWSRSATFETNRFVYLDTWRVEGLELEDPNGKREWCKVKFCEPDRLVFKPRTHATKRIWHEMSPDRRHYMDQESVRLDDNLWRSLDQAFPGQIEPTRWGAPLTAVD